MFGRLAVALLLCSACNNHPPCSLKPGPPGFERLSCPGTSTLIPIPDGRVPPGSVHGVARLFGQADSTGVRVYLQSGATAAATSTDASGNYDLTGILPGPYLLGMGFPAYLNESIDRFLVLPGVSVFPKTTLYISRNVVKLQVSNLVPSPTLDTFAVQAPGLTAIFDTSPARFQEYEITVDADVPVYSKDGQRLYVRETKPPNRLIVWDVPSATMQVLASDVIERGWTLAPDDHSVVVLDKDLQCEVWDDALQKLIVLGTQCSQLPIITPGNVVLALVQGQGTSLLTMWSLEDHSGASLGPAGDQPPQYLAMGPTFVYPARSSPARWLVVIHGRARVLRDHETPSRLTATSMPLSSDGLTLVVSDDEDGAVYLEDVQSGRRHEAAPDGYGSFLADGKTVALVNGNFDSLQLMDVLSTQQWDVSEGELLGEFPPQQLGDGLVLGLKLLRHDGSQESAVWTPDLAQDGSPVHVSDTWGSFTRTPDGSAVVVKTGATLQLLELAPGSLPQTLSESSMAEMSIAPDGQRVAYREGCPDCVRGDLKVFDRQTRTSTVIATGAVENYTFTRKGSLLLVHDFNDLADLGTLALFDPCRDCQGAGTLHDLLERVSRRPIQTSEGGTRAISWAVPLEGFRRGTLLDLRDPAAVVATPVDEGVQEKQPMPVLTERYLAFGNGSDIRPGLYITLYPATTPFFGPPTPETPP